MAPQAYYAKEQGLEGLTTETARARGAYRASPEACAYWAWTSRCSWSRCPMSRSRTARRPQTFRRGCDALPSNTTEAGRAILALDRTPAARSAARSPRRSKWRRRRRVTAMYSARYSTSVAAPVHSSPRKAGRPHHGTAGRISGHRQSAARAAVSILAALIAPFMRDTADWQGRPAYQRGRACLLPSSFTRGKYAYDFCDNWPRHPAGAQMYTRWATASCPPPTTRGACATTRHEPYPFQAVRP